ncbi:MAG: hypothetical protein MMC33_006880 [Icmadophila ericetorum]|nr:hypothetical protein [Icmadophila ericetorum]
MSDSYASTSLQRESLQKASNYVKEIGSQTQSLEVFQAYTMSDESPDLTQRRNVFAALPPEVTFMSKDVPAATTTTLNLEEVSLLRQSPFSEEIPSDIWASDEAVTNGTVDSLEEYLTQTISPGFADASQYGFVLSLMPSEDMSSAERPMTIDPQLLNYLPAPALAAPTDANNSIANNAAVDTSVNLLQCPGCTKPGCTATFKRKNDFQRHLHPGHFNCPESGCDRNGGRPFTRKDKLRDHLRQKHNLDVKNIDLE